MRYPGFWMFGGLTLALVAGLGACEFQALSDYEPSDPFDSGPRYGARVHPNGDFELRVRAPRATRIMVELFAPSAADASMSVTLLPSGDEVFAARVTAGALADAGLEPPIHYGLRVFGPNWDHDPDWRPGSDLGFVAEVDDAGNRMNPNKLLIDPYAVELSHDPIHAGNHDGAAFGSAGEHRLLDSGPVAPRSIALEIPPPITSHPRRPITGEVIYEVHVRGLTAADPSIPEHERGTYAGAARKAEYLAALGVTAVELLPLHETANDQNDLEIGTAGDNYWGYSSLNFFAPDRRYASDRSPGGPTRELRAMVEAFHAAGIKVYADVVFNHTAEGGSAILSWRGVDNAGYYQLGDDPADYVVSNGVGPNVNTAGELAADLVIDSLRYWHETIGVDGFRFDLASVVGNDCERGCFEFTPEKLLRRIADELGRDEDGRGVDLIAEPWGAVPEAYQLGAFPDGWSEWNDRYRDTIRADLNRIGSVAITPRQLVARLRGSTDVFGDRGPAASINFVTAHDGLTLRDLFSYDRRANDQPWPYGPSDGGRDDELQSSHGGETAIQRRAARTAMALLALSAGPPMIRGGDEFLRTLRGNNNAYNVDSEASWLSWGGGDRDDDFVEYTRAALAFRRRNPSLPSGRQVEVLDDLGMIATDAYLDADDRHFVALRVGGSAAGDEAAAIAVAYNGWIDEVTFVPPPPPGATRWYRVADTGPAGAAFNHWRDGADAEPVDGPIACAGRSVVVLIAR